METLTSQLAGVAREGADRVAISYRQGESVRESPAANFTGLAWRWPGG